MMDLRCGNNIAPIPPLLILLPMANSSMLSLLELLRCSFVQTSSRKRAASSSVGESGRCSFLQFLQILQVVTARWTFYGVGISMFRRKVGEAKRYLCPKYSMSYVAGTENCRKDEKEAEQKDADQPIIHPHLSARPMYADRRLRMVLVIICRSCFFGSAFFIEPIQNTRRTKRTASIL